MQDLVEDQPHKKFRRACGTGRFPLVGMWAARDAAIGRRRARYEYAIGAGRWAWLKQFPVHEARIGFPARPHVLQPSTELISDTMLPAKASSSTSLDVIQQGQPSALGAFDGVLWGARSGLGIF